MSPDGESQHHSILATAIMDDGDETKGETTAVPKKRLLDKSSKPPALVERTKSAPLKHMAHGNSLPPRSKSGSNSGSSKVQLPKNAPRAVPRFPKNGERSRSRGAPRGKSPGTKSSSGRTKSSSKSKSRSPPSDLKFSASVGNLRTRASEERLGKILKKSSKKRLNKSISGALSPSRISGSEKKSSSSETTIRKPQSLQEGDISNDSLSLKKTTENSSDPLKERNLLKKTRQDARDNSILDARPDKPNTNSSLLSTSSSKSPALKILEARKRKEMLEKAMEEQSKEATGNFLIDETKQQSATEQVLSRSSSHSRRSINGLDNDDEEEEEKEEETSLPDNSDVLPIEEKAIAPLNVKASEPCPHKPSGFKGRTESILNHSLFRDDSVAEMSVSQVDSTDQSALDESQMSRRRRSSLTRGNAGRRSSISQRTRSKSMDDSLPNNNNNNNNERRALRRGRSKVEENDRSKTEAETEKDVPRGDPRRGLRKMKSMTNTLAKEQFAAPSHSVPGLRRSQSVTPPTRDASRGRRSQGGPPDRSLSRRRGSTRSMQGARTVLGEAGSMLEPRGGGLPDRSLSRRSMQSALSKMEGTNDSEVETKSNEKVAVRRGPPRLKSKGKESGIAKPTPSNDEKETSEVARLKATTTKEVHTPVDMNTGSVLKAVAPLPRKASRSVSPTRNSEKSRIRLVSPSRSASPSDSVRSRSVSPQPHTRRASLSRGQRSRSPPTSLHRRRDIKPDKKDTSVPRASRSQRRTSLTLANVFDIANNPVSDSIPDGMSAMDDSSAGRSTNTKDVAVIQFDPSNANSISSFKIAGNDASMNNSGVFKMESLAASTQGENLDCEYDQDDEQRSKSNYLPGNMGVKQTRSPLNRDDRPRRRESRSGVSRRSPRYGLRQERRYGPHSSRPSLSTSEVFDLDGSKADELNDSYNTDASDIGSSRRARRQRQRERLRDQSSRQMGSSRRLQSSAAHLQASQRIGDESDEDDDEESAYLPPNMKGRSLSPHGTPTHKIPSRSKSSDFPSELTSTNNSDNGDTDMDQDDTDAEQGGHKMKRRSTLSYIKEQLMKTTSSLSSNTPDNSDASTIGDAYTQKGDSKKEPKGISKKFKGLFKSKDKDKKHSQLLANDSGEFSSDDST